jgi:hypothetical protein
MVFGARLLIVVFVVWRSSERSGGRNAFVPTLGHSVLDECSLGFSILSGL